MKPKIVRIAAVLSSLTLIAVYVGCRASAPAQKQRDSPEVFSGSKSEVIPMKTPEHFGGSKSAAVFEPPPEPKPAAQPEKPSQQAKPE